MPGTFQASGGYNNNKQFFPLTGTYIPKGKEVMDNK